MPVMIVYCVVYFSEIKLYMKLKLLIFINDLPNASKFYIKLFADDIFLCAQNKDFSKLENEVNIELDKVFVWLASNKLTLNTEKSKFMIVTKKLDVPEMSIKINNTYLKKCVSYISIWG